MAFWLLLLCQVVAFLADVSCPCVLELDLCALRIEQLRDYLSYSYLMY